LFTGIVQKSKLEKWKRKATEQELRDHELPEAALQMLA
jgi:hypothetical protein